MDTFHIIYWRTVAYFLDNFLIKFNAFLLDCICVIPSIMLCLQLFSMFSVSCILLIFDIYTEISSVI